MAWEGVKQLKWQHWAAVGCSAAAAGAVLYFLLREEHEEAPFGHGTVKQRSLDGNATEKERVKTILNEVQQDQAATKKITEDLINEILEKGYDFQATYKRYKSINNVSPLEKHGMTMSGFDDLLDKYTNDPEIRALVASVVHPSETSHSAANKLSFDQVIAVHKLMLTELKKIASEIHQLDPAQRSDMKSVIIAVQALIFAAVRREYKINGEDLEGAVLEHSVNLQVNSDFTQISFEISKVMSELVGHYGGVPPAGGMFPG
eukprot:Selendium_serpulae@DN4357_c0_g1_i3.p1